MELSCKSCLAKLFLKLWHGTVVQRLPCKALSQSFAWHSRAKAGLRSNFVSIRIELSCKNKLFPKLLHGSLVQKLPYEAMSWGFAWNCRAKVAPWSYLLAFAWNYAKASFQYYFSSFYVELSAKAAFQTYFLSFCVELSSKSWLAKLSLKVECRSVFPECCALLLRNGRGLGRRLSHVGRSRLSLSVMLRAAVMQKLPCEAIA